MYDSTRVVTPQRFCCAQQQFKPRDAATSLLLTTAVQNHATPRRPCCSTAVQNETPQRLDRASQPGPVRAISEHSNRLRSATKLDNTNQIAPRPPSGLTTEYSPAARAKVLSNHCSQQLPARCHRQNLAEGADESARPRLHHSKCKQEHSSFAKPCTRSE